MKLINPFPKAKETEVLTKTEIKEIEKIVEVPVEPKFEPIKPRIQEKKKNDIVAKADLIHLEQTIIEGVTTLESIIRQNKAVNERVAKQSQTVNDRMPIAIEKLHKDVVQTVNGLQTIIGSVRENSDSFNANIAKQVKEIKEATLAVKTDRLIDLDSKLQPFFIDLKQELTSLDSIEEMKANVQSSIYIYKEMKELLSSIDDKFNTIKMNYEYVDNQIDPEIKAYYLLFTDKLKDFSLVLDRIRDLEYKIERTQRGYEDTVSEQIEKMSKGYDKAVKLIEQLIETFTGQLQAYQEKVITGIEGQNKKKEPGLPPIMNVTNNTTIENKVSFVNVPSELPAPNLHTGKQIFVRKTELNHIYNAKRKGYYISDGKEWVKV